MDTELPPVIRLEDHIAVEQAYDNHVVTAINDHVVRISTMTGPFVWHCHPDSDETFLVLEGTLTIDFDGGSVELSPGEMLTVPAGAVHRTRPQTDRTVNLTFEKADAETELVEARESRRYLSRDFSSAPARRPCRYVLAQEIGLRKAFRGTTKPAC